MYDKKTVNMNEKKTVNYFREAKHKGTKITMLTAYDYPTAKLLDEAGVDSILVGDSLGMVVLGYEDTTRVTMEDMLHHIKAVVRGANNPLVVGDMPFLSYHQGKYESVKNAGRLVTEGGCKAVKLEGGAAVIEDIKAIINSGIPVMGHLGYTPQSVNLFGGHMSRGKDFDTAQTILKDALLLQDSGVFSIVLECVPHKLAAYITKELDVPVIGIGSGADCDGQILVTPDILGLFRDFKPKHVKRYADAGEICKKAVIEYISEVKSGVFPSDENAFKIDDEVLSRVKIER